MRTVGMKRPCVLGHLGRLLRSRAFRCPRGWGCRCCFFFQAEDGIRDVAVTGVQTCALPISPMRLTVSLNAQVARTPVWVNGIAPNRIERETLVLLGLQITSVPWSVAYLPAIREIGRASCRERV